MDTPVGIERCLSFIQCQLKNGKAHYVVDDSRRFRAVTISRQAGCGALAVAQKLSEFLQTETAVQKVHCTVFDRNLVEKVLEDHQLPQRLAKFMPENWISEIEDTIDELFGLHPPSSLLVRQTAETILRLAKLGNVIIIGRGANVITSRLENVFHVRLVASLEKRIQHIQQVDQLDPKAALQFIERADNGRGRYLKKYYKKDINDPLIYHLIINTDLMAYEEAARIIADAVVQSARVIST